MSADNLRRTHYRACHLCEAICGLAIVTEGEEIISIKGDLEDPFSRGYICPKAIAIQDLHSDPDRLHQPQLKTPTGWQSISWDEAFKLASEKLASCQSQHGNDSLAFYAGNPGIHNIGHMIHGVAFSRLLRTRNCFSASSCDQLPQQLIAYWMYGHQFMMPVVDIDHTDFYLIIGANPIVSNGSMMTVPDVKNRLKAIQQRGGRVVVIDPRYTETSAVADEHIFIRPGADAALLLTLMNLIFDEIKCPPEPLEQGSTSGGGFRLAPHLAPHLSGLEEVAQSVQEFTPEAVADYTGLKTEQIRRLAEQLMCAKTSAVYGRMGVSTQTFGSLCQWAVQMLNILTGNLDRVGGTLLTLPAVKAVGAGDRQAGHYGKWHSRVRNLPEFSGELPAAVMAEEITEKGEGQIRALVTSAGNPVLSTPAGHELEKALPSLDFMLSIDPYINETTCHADLILPPASPLVSEHYDLLLNRLAVRNTTRLNPAIFEKKPDERYDWEIFEQLSRGLNEARGITDSQPLPPPVDLIEYWLTQGAYNGSSELRPKVDLETLRSHPHGIDLGALQPSLIERLATDDKKIHCFLAPLQAEIPRLLKAIGDFKRDDALSLIGRRHLRSNNSWMHNSYRLVKGKDRCLLLAHPQDLANHDISDGERVHLVSSVGRITVTVKASEGMMPGVLSLPHGWGHHRSGAKCRIAAQHAGVSFNDLSDSQDLDPVSGTAIFGGIAVSLEKIS